LDERRVWKLLFGKNNELLLLPPKKSLTVREREWRETGDRLPNTSPEHDHRRRRRRRRRGRGGRIHKRDLIHSRVSS
jgi:hypothetical protein